MKPLLRAALALLGGLIVVGGAHAAPPGPPPAGDPCQRGPCGFSGAAIRLTIPLARPAPGHFAGKFELVPLFDRGRPVIRNGHSYYALRNALAFTTAAGDTVTMFAGSRTDLASTPQAVWATMPPDGAWAEAAVAHDNCYRTKGTFEVFGQVGRTRAQPYVRAECDEILRQGMVALGVSDWKRVAIFEAVRAFGSQGWSH